MTDEDIINAIAKRLMEQFAIMLDEYDDMTKQEIYRAYCEFVRGEIWPLIP